MRLWTYGYLSASKHHCLLDGSDLYCLVKCVYEPLAYRIVTVCDNGTAGSRTHILWLQARRIYDRFVTMPLTCICHLREFKYHFVCARGIANIDSDVHKQCLYKTHLFKCTMYLHNTPLTVTHWHLQFTSSDIRWQPNKSILVIDWLIDWVIDWCYQTAVILQHNITDVIKMA